MGTITHFFQLFLLLILSVMSLNSLADVTVPNVLGLTLDKAKQLLQHNGLSVGNIQEQPTNRPTGTIIVQAPKAGIRVANGYPIRLIIAIPLVKPQMTKVPNLKGLSLEQAKRAIANANLTLGHIKKRKIKMENIEVLYQSPNAGKNIVVKSRVNIILSDPLKIKGPRIKVILDKKQFQVGESILIKTNVSNIDPSKDSEYSFSINGKAYYTKSSSYQYTFSKAGRYNITASFRYLRGQWHASLTKQVFVKNSSTSAKTPKRETSKTQKPIYLKVPNVIGVPKSLAIKKLKQQGFHVGRITEEKSSNRKNIIVKQSPSAGKKIAKGSVIDLSVTIHDKKQVWQRPKAIISPMKITIAQGRKVRFSSQSLKDKSAKLKHFWTSNFNKTATSKQFIIDTQQLKAGKYQIRLLVKDNKGNTDQQSATLIVTTKETKMNAIQQQVTITQDTSQKQTSNTTLVEQVREEIIEPFSIEKNYLEALSLEAENTTEDIVLPQLSENSNNYLEPLGKLNNNDVEGQKVYIEMTRHNREYNFLLWLCIIIVILFFLVLLLMWHYRYHYHAKDIDIKYQLINDDGQQELNINDTYRKENFSGPIHINTQIDRGEQKISDNQINRDI